MRFVRNTIFNIYNKYIIIVVLSMLVIAFIWYKIKFEWNLLRAHVKNRIPEEKWRNFFFYRLNLCATRSDQDGGRWDSSYLYFAAFDDIHRRCDASLWKQQASRNNFMRRIIKLLVGLIDTLLVEIMIATAMARMIRMTRIKIIRMTSTRISQNETWNNQD